MTLRLCRAGCLLVISIMAAAQKKNTAFPDALTITRHTFVDIGPPFDFFEVIELKQKSARTYVQRVLVTPGAACRLNTSVETKTAILDKPLQDVLLQKNPCDLPKKAPKKEQKRCKHCSTFSGQEVTFDLTCNGEERRIRTDILDRDLFDRSPKTPENTSWSMRVLEQLDGALGPGALDKPIFAAGSEEAEKRYSKSSSLPILENLRNGVYDNDFKSDKKLSQIYRESLEPFALPSVELIDSDTPTLGRQVLPIYPPIAKAAQVEGIVDATFDVSPSGQTSNIQIVSGHKLLERVTVDAISQWTFPPSSEIHHEMTKIAFCLNCTKPTS